LRAWVRIPTAKRPKEATVEKIWQKSYPPGVPAELDVPDASLNDLLAQSVREFPDNVALDFEGERWTYRQLADLVDKCASVLAGLGVEKGTRVGTLMPNCPQVVIAYYAALRLGGVMVCNNPLYTERELEHQINDSGIEVMVSLDLMYDKIAAVRNDCPKLREVIVTSVFDNFHGLKALIGPKLKKEAWKAIPRTEPVKFWKDLMKGARGGTKAVAINPAEDLALLQYTGVSKGVMLTHRNLVANITQANSWITDIKRGQEVVLCALPLFHSYGQTMCMNVGLAIGGTLVLVPNPRDLGHVLKTIANTHPTIFPGVPTLYANLLQHPDLANYDMKSIRVCGSGAAPLALEVQQNWEAVTGGKLVEGYGLSETSPLTHMNPIYGKRKIGTIGLPVPGTECKLVDVDDPSKEVPAPGPGELCLAGPQVMQGYWNKPEETAEVIRDGWLHTGDVAEVDEDGFFKIVDRKKDMIIVGGFNVYPRDVEEVLYANPKVLECAVIGVPDPRSGETVKAFVVLKRGESATVEEFAAYCRENLTGYKIPKAIEFRDDLPKTMIGKVLRRALVEEERAKRAASA